MYKTQILLVEDDKDIMKINSIYLTDQGYDVITAGSLEAAYESVIQNDPSLIVLDVQMPDGSGISFCEKIRQSTSVPVIFLTCFNDEQDKVKGLMAGGDDYMAKPYGLSELAARIHALLRRVRLDSPQVLEYPPIKIDKVTQRIYLRGKDAALTHKEYQMMLLLVENIGKPMSATELYRKLWGLVPAEGIKTIHVHISSIRKKLKLDQETRVQIKTIRNVGYCFEVGYD